MSQKPKDAAAAAFVAISSAPNSTQAAIELLRDLSDAFEMGLLDHAADRLAGHAAKPGPKISASDLALLGKVKTRGDDLGRHAVGAVARMKHPGDPRAARNTEKRLRRWLEQEIGTSSDLAKPVADK